MRIERVHPPPPPAEFSLVFPQREGWALVAALNDYAEDHPHAADVKEWRQWAKDLDRALRR